MPKQKKRTGRLDEVPSAVPAACSGGLTFHQFWIADEARQQLEFLEFTKNLAIIGGLLMVIGLGPGAYSFDRRRTPG